MKARVQGCEVIAGMGEDDIRAFKAQWPCSGLGEHGVTCHFELHNGDLIDISGHPKNADGAALNALVDDLKAFVKKKCQEMKDRKTRAINGWTIEQYVRGGTHYVKPYEHILAAW